VISIEWPAPLAAGTVRPVTTRSTARSSLVSVIAAESGGETV
jgi:hypothetical protein